MARLLTVSLLTYTAENYAYIHNNFDLYRNVDKHMSGTPLGFSTVQSCKLVACLIFKRLR